MVCTKADYGIFSELEKVDGQFSASVGIHVIPVVL